MKNIGQIFFIVTFVCATAMADEWKQIWSDEFDTPGPADSGKWSYEVGKIRNREAQYYTDARTENARIEEGCLVIESRKEDYQDAQYTSASLHTWKKVHVLYGRIEVRAQIPTGRGMWPAIWMLGINRNEVRWPECGEIDILENVGFDPDIIHANVHTKDFNHIKGNGRGSKIKADAPYQNFHIYAIEWFPNRIDFFYDSTKYFTIKNDETGKGSWPFDAEHYLILNSAIGGAWGGQKGIDDSIFPQLFKIDYVRIYQHVTEKGETGSVQTFKP